MAEVLKEDYMSSEDSCLESDGEGATGKATKYSIRKLSWEGERLSRAKRALDKVYSSSLSKRAKDRILPREESDELSTRPVPDNAPQWVQE